MLFCFLNTTAQDYFRNGIDVSYSTGISGSYNNDIVISAAPVSPSPDIILENMIAARVSNISLNVFHFFNKSSGVKLTYGRSQVGFHFSGRNSSTSALSRGTFLSRSKQLGIAYIRRVKLFDYGALLIDSGIQANIQPDFRSRSFFIYPTDYYSVSGFIGYEVPLFSHNYFSTFGLAFRLPLQTNLAGDDYYPYFIGVRVGVSFQFSLKRFKSAII